VEVDINWPHQVGNDKPLGKWLLYLESVPTIESTTAVGECTISKELVNPLKLTENKEPASLTAASYHIDPSFMKRTNKSYSFSEKKTSSISTSEKQTSETVLNRVKRDRAMIIRADKLVDAEGKKTNTVTMVSELKVVSTEF
jgi:integrin alpha 7